MLSMLPTDDKKLLDRLSYAVFSSAYDGGVGFVFYEDELPVGFARVDVSDVSCIKTVGILPEFQKKGYGDFFTRSILFRLAAISTEIRIGYKSGYFLQFGFVNEDGGMRVASDKLVFNDKCAHS